MNLRRATLHQMKVFLALAHHLNMTRAAQELHMTPPALSIQIKQLAETVGEPLHEQIGKRLYLTTAGRLVEAACRDLFARLDQLAEELNATHSLERGALRIAIITTAKYFVPRMLGDFCTRYPGIEIALEVANRDQILERLQHNQDDLYIMGQVPEQFNVVAQPLMENPLVVIAPAGHHLDARRRRLSPQQLEGEAFIMREPGSGTRLAAERFFQQHGLSLDIRMTLGSSEAVKQAVAGGLGLAVVSQHTLTLDAASGAFCILNVKGFPLLRHWYAVYPKGKRLSQAARVFKEHVIAEAAG